MPARLVASSGRAITLRDSIDRTGTWTPLVDPDVDDVGTADVTFAPD